MTTSIAIHTDNLTRDFNGLRALDQLSIRVPCGTIFGFLGTNGAGKTTTIRLLLGLLAPTSGDAHVLGYDVRTQAGAIREQCGALLEHTGLYERLNALDNLDFYGRAWRLDAPTRTHRIQELLSHLGLWERRMDSVGEWSRGMKQKLALARALLHRPQLLFLDEPTAGLDPLAAANLRDDLASLVAHEGITVFLTTHNLHEAEKLCHQVAVIRAGKVLAIGTPDQLTTQETRIRIIGTGFGEDVLALLPHQPDIITYDLQEGELHLHLKAGASTAPLVKLLVMHGVAVEQVIKMQNTLEETFLNLVEG